MGRRVLPDRRALRQGPLSQYYTSKNFDIGYIFDSSPLSVLAIQLVTGIALVMNYERNANQTFGSVECTMRDAPSD